MVDDVVIGLEVHVQLQTQSKLFCGCSTKFGDNPNANTCPVCLGWPGTLPVLNKKALEYGILASLALNCKINQKIKFDRKNYYYPDLPKAYQISQYDLPLAEHGTVKFNHDGESCAVGIERLHLEEDAGKLVHSSVSRESYVDYNRSGTPLAEIVTKPELTSPERAESFLRTLKKQMEYLDVSDCNMDEGSLRCDANISIRRDDGSLGTKAEIKNMNSFKAVRKALSYEVLRQRKLLSRGQRVVQETRLWDETTEQTKSMRSKEEAHDYRYFPEPDLVPVRIDKKWQQEIGFKLPELPDKKFNRFLDEYQLTEEAARTLTDSRPLADFFEQAIKPDVSAKTVGNLIISDVKRELNERGWDIGQVALTPAALTSVASLLEENLISSNVGSELIAELVESGGDPREIVEQRGLKQISSEDQLSSVILQVVSENPDAVADIRGGKNQAIGFLVGQVMQKTGGQADPGTAQKLLREEIL